MTIVIPDDDTQYDEHILESAEERDGGWALEHGRGWYLWTANETGTDYVPKAGDKVRFYGKGMGYYVRGVSVEGHVFRYMTEDEEAAKHLREKEEREAEMRAEFEAARADMDRRFDALPEPFQKRIERRRRNNPDFRWRYESYEMFVCEEAVKFTAVAADARLSLEYHKEIADFWADEEMRKKARMEYDPPEDFIAQFFGWASALNSEAYDYDYARQQQVLGTADGHSGNTFGMAMRLAYLYADGNYEGVDKHYGAMAPLVGSEEYGDIDPEDLPKIEEVVET